MSDLSSRRNQTRLALIEAATHVIASHGIDASVEQFSEAAGFTRGAFYSNFASKTELCQMIIQHYAEKDLNTVEQVIAQSLRQPSTVDEMIDQAINNFLNLWGANLDTLLTLHLIRLAAAHDDELRKSILRTDSLAISAIGPLFDEVLARHGVVPILPSEALFMVLRSVYLASLLDEYLAGTLDFDLLRTRLTTVLKALLLNP